MKTEEHSFQALSSFRLHPSALLFGAGDEIRTRDPQLGRLMLYQLSYTRPTNFELRISDCGFNYPLRKSEIRIPKSEIRNSSWCRG
jgi:hypothetical protein